MDKFTEQDTAEFIRIDIEHHGRVPETLADACKTTLEKARQMIENPAFRGDREHFASRIQALMDEIEVWKQEKQGNLNSTWNESVLVSHRVVRYGPLPEDKWLGMDALYEQYKSAPGTKETAMYKCRLLRLAIQNEVILRGGRQGRMLYLGIQQRKKLSEISEGRAMLDPPSKEELIGAEMMLYEELCKGVDCNRLEQIHKELDALWEKITPHRVIT